MNTRPFGSGKEQVSEIGLGCWQLGGDMWGDMSDENAFAILRAAVDSGTNFLDTADVYGDGRSEELIGRFRKQTTEPLFIATKLGRRGDPGWPGNFTDETIRRHTEDSLRRLSEDTLDLTQLHCIPTEELQKGEVFESLRRLKTEGKIRRFGASVESNEQALICLDQDGLSSLQIIFNIFRQKPITELFDLAKAKNVAIIVRLPLASGLLSGRLRRETQFAPNDHRLVNRDGQLFNVGETFAGIPYETGVVLSNELKPLVPYGWTMAQMALRWILDYDAVTTIIPGASNPDQAESNAQASALPSLPAALHERLASFYSVKVRHHIRGPY